MIKIGITKQKNSFVPIVEIEENTNLSSTELAIILYWLEQGLYSKSCFQALSKELDKKLLKTILNKFMTFNKNVSLLNEQTQNRALLEAAKTPIIPSDAFLSFGGGQN